MTDVHILRMDNPKRFLEVTRAMEAEWADYGTVLNLPNGYECFVLDDNRQKFDSLVSYLGNVSRDPFSGIGHADNPRKEAEEQLRMAFEGLEKLCEKEVCALFERINEEDCPALVITDFYGGKLAKGWASRKGMSVEYVTKSSLYDAVMASER